MVFCWIVLQFSSSLFKVTHLSHAMCHVQRATLDTIILQYSTSFLYCTNIKIHKHFIKYNVRKTVNPILFKLRLLNVLFDPFESKGPEEFRMNNAPINVNPVGGGGGSAGKGWGFDKF